MANRLKYMERLLAKRSNFRNVVGISGIALMLVSSFLRTNNAVNVTVSLCNIITIPGSRLISFL